MKNHSTKLLAIAAAAVLSGCAKRAAEPLKIYSIIHDEETKALTDLFTRKTGIQTEYLRTSTGELINRVIAEKNNPQADVLLGGARSYHIKADKEGALQHYQSPEAANLPEYAKSSEGAWTGFCVLTLGAGVNRERFTQKFSGIPYPATWEDLLNPAFKGEIVMTDPAASSTAYLFVQNQLQRLGWDTGWNYLLALAPLVGQFPDSGSAPAKLTGAGEYAIGISYIHALAKYKAQGFDIDLIAMPQAAGDVDCVSILNGTKNREAAEKFVDFVLSAEAQELMSSLDFTTPVNPQARVSEGVVPLENIDLIDYDFQKAAEQRDEVLLRWSKEVQ
ncbi:MAG: ABC transporter substrate-binding protein [Treponema sp.]